MFLSPELSKIAVHKAVVFTTGVFGLLHLWLGDFDNYLFLKLLILKVSTLAIALSWLGLVINENIINPYIGAYLIVLRLLIFIKAFKKPNKTLNKDRI